MGEQNQGLVEATQSIDFAETIMPPPATPNRPTLSTSGVPQSTPYDTTSSSHVQSLIYVEYVPSLWS
jgi:hypothetical protein